MTKPDIFFKDTKSLCPTCLEEIDGQLFFRDDQLIVTKFCPRHGESSGVVDPDATLYLQCVTPPGRKKRPYATVIPISLRCNLDCTWCYLPERGKELEPDPEAVMDTIDRCGSRYIVFSGGEPTLREDLVDLFRTVRRRFPDRIPSLLTNGVRLTDYAYLEELKEAGLGCIIFSFNGFRRETNEYFSGRDLTESKAAVLANLKRLGIPTILSMTIAKGINEDEFKPIYEYGLRNIDFVRALRLRNVSDIGVFTELPHLYMTDMIKGVSRATGFTVEEMCQINAVANHSLKSGNHFLFNMFSAVELRNRPAVFREHRGERELNPGELAAEIKRRFRADAERLIGAENTRRMSEERPDAYLSMRNFVIEIFSWPTSGNIDLSECRQMAVNHIGPGGAVMPFLEALFANERMRKSKSVGQ